MAGPGALESAARSAAALLGYSPPPSRVQAMLKARRQFDVSPVDMQAVEDGTLPVEAFLDFAQRPGLRGAYASSDVAASAPVPRLGLRRSMAMYPRGDRAARRHEVMHGIQHVARTDPEVDAVIPWWARGATRGSFADELLARLAQREPGAVLDWPTARYASGDLAHGSRWPYRVADPVLWAGRQVRDRPYVAGGVLGGLGAAAAARLAESE